MKSNSTVRSRLAVFILVFVLGVVAMLVWWKDSTLPVDATDDTTVEFTIHKDDGVRFIASDLTQKKLIRSPTAFFILVKFLGIERNLQAGDFRLNRAMDTQTLARELTHGYSDIWVRTLEGWRSEEVATEVSKKLDIPSSEFLKLAREGYMFPDSYSMPRDATVGAVAAIFMDNFANKVTNDLRAKTETIGLSFEDAIILASIVEREGVNDTDRPVIAGILLKRLRAGWPLQVDATLQYALGYQSVEKSWWKKHLTAQDKEIQSPYNTYTNTGLPPQPICNPGLKSIEAVLSPVDTQYWFYIHDIQGVAHYAVTAEEHAANINNYL